MYTKKRIRLCPQRVSRSWSTNDTCVQVLAGHTSAVTALTVFQGFLYSGSDDGEIRKWDANDTCLQVLKGHTNRVLTLTVFQDHLYSGSYDATIRKWDANGTCVQVLDSGSTLRALTVFLDHLYSGSSDGEIRKWDLSNAADPGASRISHALEHNHPMLELYLDYHTIGPDEAQRIGRALEHNHCLHRLSLQNNHIGNEGVAAIVRGIAINRNNSRLRIVNVSNNQITRLPAELTQCPPTLTNFDYYGNEIDYIPPNVQRWLGRFQQQQNAHIHQDSQNVHNRQIQQCVKDSLNKIINAGPPKYQYLDEVREIIVKDSILSAQCKTQLIEYALDNNEHTGLGVTFAEALQYVFTRIDLNKESGDEIKRILNQEMTDALCMCFTGRISRLLNCLTAIDPLVHIHIVSLSDMFRNVGQRLIKEEKYTAEVHQTQFEKELQEDYGYELTEEFRKEVEEKYYSVLDIFYDIYNIKDTFINIGKRLIKEKRYTTEAHQAQFEKVLQEDYGYELTEEFKKEIEEKYYCAIEDFNETYEHNTEL